MNFVAEAETCLCVQSDVVPRLLLDCIEFTEAQVLQMGKITES